MWVRYRITDKNSGRKIQLVVKDRTLGRCLDNVLPPIHDVTIERLQSDPSKDALESVAILSGDEFIECPDVIIP